MEALPVRHLTRLIEVCEDEERGGATRLSAKVVESWLESLQGEDPVAVLEEVMGRLGGLPGNPADLLGSALYRRVQRVRGFDAEDIDSP